MFKTPVNQFFIAFFRHSFGLKQQIAMQLHLQHTSGLCFH